MNQEDNEKTWNLNRSCKIESRWYSRQVSKAVSRGTSCAWLPGK